MNSKFDKETSGNFGKFKLRDLHGPHPIHVWCNLIQGVNFQTDYLATWV